MSRMIRMVCLAALAAAGLSGCAQIDSYSVRDERAAQDDVIGDVVDLGATFCLDDQSAPPALAARGAAGLVVGPAGDGSCDPEPAQQPGVPAALADDGGVQFFAAFLVPDSATAPATATAHLPAAFGAAAVTLTRKPSLDETLAHTRPAPEGRRWVGYISPVVGAAASFATAAQAAEHLRHAALSDVPAADGASTDWDAQAAFRAGRGDGGFPVPTSFAHAVIGGTRLAYPEDLYAGVDASQPGVPDADRFGLQLLDTRPVDCQELREFPYTQLFGQSLESLPETPSGLPLLTTTLCGRPSAEGTLALKDLRGAGGVATAAAGTTATVPFTLRYAGDPGPTFALHATSAVPGATANPSAPALTPAAAGFQDAGVQVAVPAGTAPGDYAVILTATAGGQARTAQGTLTVTAPAGGGAGPAGPTAPQDPGTVAAAAVPAASRLLEFRGFDRSGPGPDGRSINLGDVLCHKTEGSCGLVTVQLTVRWDQLHAGAEAAGRSRVRMVVIGTTHLGVPAQGRRRVRITVGRSVRHMLATGEVLHAVVAVRPAHNRVPIVHRIALRRG